MLLSVNVIDQFGGESIHVLKQIDETSNPPNSNPCPGSLRLSQFIEIRRMCVCVIFRILTGY